MEKGRSREIQAGPEPKYDHRTITKGEKNKNQGQNWLHVLCPYLNLIMK